MCCLFQCHFSVRWVLQWGVHICELLFCAGEFWGSFEFPIIAFSSSWCCQPPPCCINLSILLAASFCILWRNLLDEPCALSLGSVVTWCRFHPILFQCFVCDHLLKHACLYTQAVTWQYLAGVGRPMRGIWISLRWHTKVEEGWKGKKWRRWHYITQWAFLTSCAVCCLALSSPFQTNGWWCLSCPLGGGCCIWLPCILL